MALIHKQRGGVWIGTSFFSCWKVTWPIGSIELYDDRVILKAPPEKVVEIPLDKITLVKKVLFFPVIAWGFKIEHQDENLPGYIFFWYMISGKKISKFFEEKGVQIK